MNLSDFRCGETHHHPEKVAAASGAMLTDAQLDRMFDLFRTIADPTRLRILAALRMGEMCVCDLADTLNLTQSAVSHQLSYLRASRTVKCRRDGKQVLYSLHDSHVMSIFEMCAKHAQEE